jgi:hypothetical protein
MASTKFDPEVATHLEWLGFVRLPVMLQLQHGRDPTHHWRVFGWLNIS